MSFSSYTNFGNSLSQWLLDNNNATMTDVGVSVLGDLITVAENRLFREARTRDMEVALSTSIGSGVVAVPSGFISFKHFYVNSSPLSRLEVRTAEWIYNAYPNRVGDGLPKYFARDATNFVFGPYPDSSYTVNGVYYKHLAAISGAALNALFTANPDLYLMACLAEGDMVIGRDARVAIWESKYQKLLTQVNGEDLAAGNSGSNLQMRVARFP